MDRGLRTTLLLLLTLFWHGGCAGYPGFQGRSVPQRALQSKPTLGGGITSALLSLSVLKTICAHPTTAVVMVKHLLCPRGLSVPAAPVPSALLLLAAPLGISSALSLVVPPPHTPPWGFVAQHIADVNL